MELGKRLKLDIGKGYNRKKRRQNSVYDQNGMLKDANLRRKVQMMTEGKSRSGVNTSTFTPEKNLIAEKRTSLKNTIGHGYLESQQNYAQEQA